MVWTTIVMESATVTIRRVQVILVHHKVASGRAGVSWAAVVPEVPTMVLEAVVAALHAVPEIESASMNTRCRLAV
jgi:hypothetical protein